MKTITTYLLKAVVFSCFLLSAVLVQAQEKEKNKRTILEKNADTIEVFQGTQIAPQEHEYDSTGSIKFGVYMSTYYASYSAQGDSATGYSDFATIAPRNNMFGLNLLQASVRYSSNRFRTVLTGHTGDIPASAWSPTYNFIQEANVGVRLHRHIWFDAGLFRTYIGLESIQPRENVTMSLAIPTFFEPYFMSGVKLTYQPKDNLAIQANAFNAYNGFVENNKNKTLGVSVYYDIKGRYALTYNFIYCDEFPDGSNLRHGRTYSNFYGIMKMKNQVLATELNFGTQQHSKLTNEAQSAFMYSGLLTFKQWVHKRNIAAYGRVEYYYDPNAILTPVYQNENGDLRGLNCAGATGGLEFKFIPNSYIRLETRYLGIMNDATVFRKNDEAVDYRLETILGMGVWF